MKTIQIHGKEFEVSITEEKIQQAVQRVANDLNRDLRGKEVVFLPILNGAFMFASDIFRRIEFDARISFLKTESYTGTSSTGHITQVIGLNENIKGKTVVILEDIIDSGLTMENVIEQVRAGEPAEIKIATFLFKPDAFVKDFHIDYIALKIPNDFIVGYGLDYDGFGRNYRDIYTVKSDKFLNLLIFGAPGAGKGTQSKQIIERYNLVHLSTGDILRAEIEQNSRIGQLAKRYMTNGGFVPDEIVLSMIMLKIMENKGASGFIFDGFPRTVEQARRIDALMREESMPISAMIALEVGTEELKRRLVERGKTGRRADDTPDIIENRIKIYHEKTAPVKEYYREQGKLREVHGEGAIEDIFRNIEGIIENL